MGLTVIKDPPLLELVAKIKPTLRDQDVWSVAVPQDVRRSEALTAEQIDDAFDALRDKVKELLL